MGSDVSGFSPEVPEQLFFTYEVSSPVGDHVIVLHASSLRRTLDSYFDYYHRSRTHLSLGKDSPEPRPIQPAGMGPVVALPQVGGLHHRYERRAA